MLTRLGDSYADVLVRHHAIVRSELARHDGTEVDTAGDGFFAFFRSPGACVAAVIEMQRQLSSAPWPEAAEVRVRMGIHTGVASAQPVALVGVDVHRAARIAAVGHGGQVLVSETAAALTRDRLPEDARLRDLGTHRLKDLGRPEQIFQLEASGLRTKFPPLRSLDNPELPNNLPSLASAFIGRAAELSQVEQLVRSSRLVTLSGPGGCGKTRLGLQVAANLLDGSMSGVFFVDLAPVVEPAQVAAAVVSGLGLRPHGEESLVHSVVEALRDQSILLVLDNCEHVIDACAELADRVGRSCPKMHLLATSREPLAIDGEQVYRVPSLSLAPEEVEGLDDLAESDAVTLFAERATGHDSLFVLDSSRAPLVAAICRRLDGIPLALELAAGRLSSMSLEHLGQRLDEHFRLLNRGSRTAPPRQQTLRATIAWSYDLLNGHEQALLRRLSVFSGGFDLEAAEALCATGGLEAFEVDEDLGSLVDKSLVLCEQAGRSLRYRLLETIRHYTSEQLRDVEGTDEVARARAAHGAYYVDLAERIAPALTGPAQARLLRCLDLEWDNIWATFSHLKTEPGGSEAVLRLATALDRFLWSRGRVEVLPVIRAVLDGGDQLPSDLRARTLLTMARIMDSSWDDLSVPLGLCEQALRLARMCDDRSLLAYAAGATGCLRALVLQTGDGGAAQQLAEMAVDVARQLEDKSVLCEALIYLNFSQPAPRLEIHEEALRAAEEAGDLFLMCTLHGNLADFELRRGRVEAARRHCVEGIVIAENIGSAHTLLVLHGNLAHTLVLQGEFAEAASLYRRTLIGCRQRGLMQQVGIRMWGLACCATGAGDYSRAALLHGAAEGVVSHPRLYPIEDRLRSDDQARLRHTLGDLEFDQGYRAGRALSFEDAVDLALTRPR